MARKRIVLCIMLCCIGTFSIYAQAKGRAQAALSQFEQTFPEYRGKVFLSEGAGGDRTWQEQMGFILEHPQSYSNISQRFTQQFGLKLPASSRQMASEMLNWWEREIMAQAGRLRWKP
ncbi:hypothetical protein AGMMS49940_16880 [Spirochaetia bacterium]|nr:hypothetical protein AGMMS49940_16880 [Spirochaetia bacterium]